MRGCIRRNVKTWDQTDTQTVHRCVIWKRRGALRVQPCVDTLRVHAGALTQGSVSVGTTVQPRGECVPPRVLSSCQRATYSADSLHGVFYLEKMPIRGENGEGAIVTVGDQGRRYVLEG